VAKATMISWAKAKLAVSKSLRVRSEKELREHLDFAGYNAPEAYRLGVEETQHELIARINALRPADSADNGNAGNG